MQFLTQMQTGVTVTKISKSQNHLQSNSQHISGGLSRWPTKKFSVGEKISIW